MRLVPFGVTKGIYPINRLTHMLSLSAIYHNFVNIVSLFWFFVLLSVSFIVSLLLFRDFRNPWG